MSLGQSSSKWLALAALVAPLAVASPGNRPAWAKSTPAASRPLLEPVIKTPRPPSPSPTAAPIPPGIQSLLKPKVYQRAMAREVMSHASLDSVRDGLKRYSYYTVMLAHVDLRRAHRLLTDYHVYAKIIPYVDRADFNPKTQVLWVEGGIWKFRLSSWVRFQDVSERWIRYEIVGGHFRGLKGNIYFEPKDEKGTLVYLDGALEGTNWPPTFVIEQGAQIVFGFTGKRMRSYMEHD
jgi:hypothetical protein